MKVIRIPLRNLRNEEWYEAHTDFKKEVLRYGPEALGLQNLWLRYIPLYNKADKLLEVTPKSALTKDVEDADKKRDEVFQGLYALVKGSQKQPNENKLNAARRLFIVLKEYRNDILHSTYNQESGALRNLLQDLTGPRAADVTLLGFGDWTTALSQAEQNFRAVYDERRYESVAKPKEDFKLIRTRMDTLYTSSVNVLEAQLEADDLGGDTVVDPNDFKDGIYEADVPDHLRGNVTYNFVLDWNESLKKYHNALQQRAGRRAKDKNEDEDSEIEEEG